MATPQRPDFNALVPAQPVSEQVRLAALRLEPGQARESLLAAYEVPPDDPIHSAPRIPDPGERKNAAELVQKTILQASEGKLSPFGLRATLNTLQPYLQTMGFRDPASFLNSPDGKDILGSAAEAQIKHMNDMGIHLNNEDAYKQRYIQYLNGSEADRTRLREQANSIAATRAANEVSKTASEIQRNYAEAAKAGAEVERLKQQAQGGSALAITSLQKYAASKRQVLDEAVKRLDSVNSAINNANNAGTDPAIIANLTAEYGKLYKQIYGVDLAHPDAQPDPRNPGLQNQLNEVEAQYGKALNQSMSTLSGKPTTFTNIQNSGKTPVAYQMRNGVKWYKYSDGSEGPAQ
jgi:hypothetical protein